MRRISEKLFSKPWLPPAVLAVFGFALYFQTFFFGFSYLDDNTLILDNKAFLANLGNIFAAFQTDVFRLFNHSAAYYRSIFTLYLMLNYQIGGTSSFIYHFSGLILHVLAAWLVYIFLKKLDYKKEISFLFSLIFLVHPVLTQAVAWIPGSNDSLLAVFVFASFISFIDFLKRGEKKYFSIHLLFFALAIFTKETALFAIPIFIFYGWFVRQDGKMYQERKRIVIGWIVILGIYLTLRHFALLGSDPMSFGNMLKSVFINSPAAIQYIGKIIFPFGLSVLPISRNMTFGWGISALFLLVIIFFLTKNKRWRYITFGAFWFSLFLFPSFVRPNPAIVADFIEHRLYLPMAGFFIFILEMNPLGKWRNRRIAYYSLSMLTIIIFGAIAYSHSFVFKDRVSFWKDAVEHSPDYPLARRNLGAMEYLDGDYANAEMNFKAALALNPNEEMAHNNLGLIYASQNKLDEAEAEYKKEIAINPYYDSAYFNLGLLYYKEGKISEAEDSWKKTVAINPNYTDALMNLTQVYYSQKDYKNAAIFAGRLSQMGYSLPPEFSNLLTPLNFIQLNQSP